MKSFETLVIHFKTKGLYTPSAILEGEFFFELSESKIKKDLFDFNKLHAKTVPAIPCPTIIKSYIFLPLIN